MRIRTPLCAFFAAMILWAASPHAAKGQPINWPVFTTTGLNQPSGEAIAFMVERAGTSSGSRLVVGETKLSQVQDFCAALKEAVVGYYIAALSTYRTCFNASALQAMDFPFLARDWTEARDLLNGPIGLAVVDTLRSNGVDVLSFWQGDARVLASQAVLASSSDLKGRKILGPQTYASRAAIEMAGAQSVPLAFAETAVALQRGLGDTVDAPLTFFQDALSQFTRTALVTNHSLEPYVLAAPTKVMSGLPSIERAFLESLVRRATAFQADRARALQSSQVERLRDRGFRVAALSDADRSFLKENALIDASRRQALQVFESTAPTIRAAAISQVSGQAQSTYFQVRFATTRGRNGYAFTNSAAADLAYGKATIELEFDQQLSLPAEIIRSLISFGAKGNGVQVDWQTVAPAPPSKEFTQIPPHVPAKAPLVYVHGFANTFEEALRRGAWLGWNAKRPVLVFAWPSQGSPTPSDYRTDQAIADKSAVALARMLRDVGSSASGATDVDVVVHSMGGRVLVAALKELQRTDRQENLPRFRQVVFVAPDVGARDLKTDWATLHAFFIRKATLYVSDHDLALGISRQVMNPADGPRAGLAPPVLVCDEMESIFIGPNEFSLTGHSYHVANGVIVDDLMEALRYGVAAINRRGIIPTSGSDQFYELRRLRTP